MIKTIDVDEEPHHYVASHTQQIGGSASDILRPYSISGPQRLLLPSRLRRQKRRCLQDTPVRPRGVIIAVRELLLSDEYAAQSKARSTFMLVLSTLHCLEPNAFSATSLIVARVFCWR
ncbi:MAG: hypothetical protein ACSLEM_05005 [Candidatus Malihini olakiniferum]